MKITFYPDSGDRNLLDSIKKYQAIWREEGKRIVESIEKISGLKFKEKYINAIVFKARLPSRSYPLSLRADLPDERKLATLVHELCHRILVSNGIGPLKKEFRNEKERMFEVHKVLNLILYDIWSDLYGKGFAKRNVLTESKSQRTNVYKIAWDWALSFNKRERAKKFSDLQR